jgi:alpha-D-xyloside xylohydrolase
MFTRSFLRNCIVAAATIMLTQGCSKQESNSSSSSSATSVVEQQALFESRVQKIDNGIIVSLPSASAKKIRVQLYTDDIVRVTALPGDSFDVIPESIQVIATPKKIEFDVVNNVDKASIITAKLNINVDLKTGQVTVFDKAGNSLLKEETRGNFDKVTADPVTPDADSFAVRQEFNRGSDEGYFGLGQHQNNQVNWAGENVELTTYNLVISVPFLVSSKNYGILWDNNSITRVGDPRETQPLNKSLTLYDTEGKAGGMTARYYDGDTLLLTRVESDLNYQYLEHNSVREIPFPDEAKDAEKKGTLRVEWEGEIEAATAGLHRFKLYQSGFVKMWVNGEEVMNRWRLNWNPWYNTYNLKMAAGEKVRIKTDWKVDGGYFRLTHLDPVASEQQGELSFASDTGKSIDYYVVVGNNSDEVIAGYRHLTGQATMLPKWAFGFWQSRERYKSQQEIIDTFTYYRNKKIPIDNIVLDWSYWPENAWGSHDFDKEFFPDPKALTDKIHEMNGNIMISVWPKFYPTTETYKELNAKGYMFNGNLSEGGSGNLDWIGKGYLNAFYDPFPKEAQQIFWKQINEKIKSKGFDAWWLDASEPDIHSNLSFTKRKLISSREGGVASGAENFNAYAVPNAMAVYEGERAANPEKRSFILTRSGFGGIQRTGSAIWSGDTSSTWQDMEAQVAAGVNTGLAGVPYWTFDIGGFTPPDNIRWDTKAGTRGTNYTYKDVRDEYLPEWQELNIRWFQFGAFTPLFRSHGQSPYREIFNLAGEGTEPYAILKSHIELRYRLMPYIYTLAGDAFHKQSTMMRGFVMDFPQDKKAWNISDQYMFGSDILVSPIFAMNARSRDVYLPANTEWYNFHTGEKFSGGSTINVAAPLNQIPLFVRAGAIIPTGPVVQHVDEGLNAPLTLNVYAGKDGYFEIYEDDGRSTKHEQGKWSRIPVTYNAAENHVVIGKREGSFEGMATERSISVKVINGPSADAANFDKSALPAVKYLGEEIKVAL